MKNTLGINYTINYCRPTDTRQHNQHILTVAIISDILVLKIILVLAFIQFWVNNFYFSFSFSFEIILVSISVLVSVLK